MALIVAVTSKILTHMEARLIGTVDDAILRTTAGLRVEEVNNILM